MLTRFIPFIICILLILNDTKGQRHLQQDLLDVNKVWSSFYAAFDSLDHTKMEQIHHTDLIRISGGKRIVSYSDYMDGYKRQFDHARKNGETSRIELRFFERLNNGVIASERGIYKLIRNEHHPDTKIYYGQFHVIMTKIDDQWWITMDYDSSENNTIHEEDFLASYPIDDFTHFLPSK